MENELKFYLLAQLSGWNTSTYAYDYRNELVSSNSYQILSYNILEVKKHYNNEAKRIYNEYTNLKLEPINLKDVFVVQTQINYLSLHSFPEYYLNPFSIPDTYSGSVTSIGDLMVENDSVDMSINSLIFDENITIERKKEIIEEKTLFYLDEMNQLVYDSMELTLSKTFKDQSKNPKLQFIKSILEQLIFFLSNVFLFITFIHPSIQYWNAIYSPKYDSYLTYVSYIFMIVVFLNNLVYIIFHSYKAKIFEPFNYAKRFLKKRVKTVLDDIKKNSDNFYDYVVGAILNKYKLENDIKNFSKLSTSYIDLLQIINVSDMQNKKSYKVLYNLSVSFLTITGIVLLIAFVSYIFSFTFGVNL